MTDTDPGNDGRGGAAQHPLRIPLSGWRDIALRIKNQLQKDNIGIVSAGVSFYALLAIFPALSAVVATYGMMFDTSDVQQQMSTFIGLLPEQARSLLTDQLDSLVSASSTNLGLGVALGLAVAFWSSTKGAKAIMSALNIVYEEKESRGLIKLNLTAMAITLSAILIVVLAMISAVIVPTILKLWSGLDVTIKYFAWLRWPIIAIVMMLSLSAVYRFGPSRRDARWRWVTLGGTVATILWLCGSWLFSFYVSNFGNYNQTYGSIGAVIVLLMWFFVSTWIFLLGAEINAEIEHQTAIDSTIGKPQPLGQRGATMADTVGTRFNNKDS